MEYNFTEIESKWRARWAAEHTFRVENDPGKKKYYVLDMFPYPSGAGLHVGHPLGYIASDIVARYRRHGGYNVLHPMGYDSFGLPAEQYAIQTGQHPRLTTEENIARYRGQLDRMGFSFDWSREVRTSDPAFYKWTQWIFLKLFNSWYNPATNRAEPIDTLIKDLESQKKPAGTHGAAKRYSDMTDKEKSEVLMSHRLAFLSDSWVNWCPALGTVLANEEVKDGLSERGGHPVERKLLPQWSLRITAYAGRLLKGLDDIDWSTSMKESQRNWIGRSEGSSLSFMIEGQETKDRIEVFTTRPDTVFGVTFMTLAPEHELATQIAPPEYKNKVDEYVRYARNRNERERQTEIKNITGQFTGAYALHPFTGARLPVWIADYVLAGYGTGAVMGVPAHDARDFAFARHFQLPVQKVIEPNDPALKPEPCFDTYDGVCVNSDFLNGLTVPEAVEKAINEIEKAGLGSRKINYRLRDAVFGRQRYWGEPIPIYYRDGLPQAVDEEDLPLRLPEVDKYLPTETGEPPLARARDWQYRPHARSLSRPFPGEGQGGARTAEAFPLETTTMPGWAGSSWYLFRYMDPQNDQVFAAREALDYWREADLYIGGNEHATGHLLYVRFWTKFLFDLGLLPVDEPAKKLINQGMIQGRSNFIYRVEFINQAMNFDFPVLISFDLFEAIEKGQLDFNELNTRISRELTLKNASLSPSADASPVQFRFTKIHVDVNHVNDDILDLEKLRKWKPEFREAVVIDNGKCVCGWEIEKMSKRWHNVVNPDDICDRYGADCLRLYEMFLGPLEQSKPWNTNGITGVFGFLRKLWKLFHDEHPAATEQAREAALKSLHRLIKKVTSDIEGFSFNTSVSAFMICVNEISAIKCGDADILEPLCILLSPFAPHLAEELWEKTGHAGSISTAPWPIADDKYLTEQEYEYPVSVNGKTRFKLPLSLQLSREQVEQAVLAASELLKYTNGRTPRKIIVVPGRIVNVVL